MHSFKTKRLRVLTSSLIDCTDKRYVSFVLDQSVVSVCMSPGFSEQKRIGKIKREEEDGKRGCREEKVRGEKGMRERD